MTSKYKGHTPGPWMVYGVRHKGDLKLGDMARLHMVGPDDDPVTAVFFDMRTGKGFADARLIADAPTLLAENRRLREALELIESQADDLCGVASKGNRPGDARNWKQIADIATAALKEAAA